METIQSKAEFDEIVARQDAVLAYFSTEVCSVCKVLKPKIAEMVEKYFPLMEIVYIQSDLLPEVAAQNSIFVAPTVIVFFAGRETIRKSRAFSVDEFMDEISRSYSLLFGE